MKYLLALIGDESGSADRTPDQQAQAMRAWDAYTQALVEAGVFVGGEGLAPSSTATTVQIRDGGDPIVSDGPFAETKEQLGGYYLLDCKDLDEAIRWAAQIPGAQDGSVEVRPVMDYEAMGGEPSNQAEGAAH